MADLSKHVEFALETIKKLYFHYYNAYGYQTWKRGDLLTSRGSDPNITWAFNQVVLRDHVTN